MKLSRSTFIRFATGIAILTYAALVCSSSSRAQTGEYLQPNCQVVGTGDFTGDGNTDLVLENISTGNIFVWSLEGTSYVANLPFRTTSGDVKIMPSGWHVAGVGDFDADGKPDLIVQNLSTHQVAVWQMNGLTMTAGYLVGSGGIAKNLPSGFQVAGAGDFNSDGKTDIVIENLTSHAIATWLLNGVTFVNSVNFTNSAGAQQLLPSGYQIGGVGDFNNDGKPDLVVQSLSTGNVAAWMMNGTVFTLGLFFMNGANTLQLPVGYAGSAVADFDYDGRADLVIQNLASKQVSTWLMSGTTYKSTQIIGGIRYTNGFSIGAPAPVSTLTPDLQLNGSSNITSSGRLQLTPNSNYIVGSTWFTNPMYIRKFSTTFDFQFTVDMGGGLVADGITFSIQNAGLSALGTNGGFLGYSGINNSVAIKFDIYNNYANGDPSANCTGVYTNGAAPFGGDDLTPSLDLHAQHLVGTAMVPDTFTATLSYQAKHLTVTLTDDNTADKKTFTKVYPIDIEGTVNNDTAFVGFTAGTAFYRAQQEILFWTFGN